jgi:hypothetical protein
MSLEEHFGYSYESHEEVTNGTQQVVVKCSPTAPGAKPLLIKARKLKAIATNIKPKDLAHKPRASSFGNTSRAGRGGPRSATNQL